MAKDNEETPVEEELPVEGEEEETPADESGEEGEESEESEESEETTAEDRKQADNLYKLLKDPATAGVLIRTLAEQNGILQKVDAPKDDKSAKKAIKDLVTDGLGAQYAFLVPQLTQVIESVLTQEREERNTQISQIENQQVERDVVATLSKLNKETKGESKKLEGKMHELMQKFQPGPGISVEDYIRGIYAQASAGRTTKTVAANMADRIRRNANDASSRLQNTSTGTGKSAPPGKMNIHQSVEFALSQMNKGQK